MITPPSLVFKYGRRWVRTFHIRISPSPNHRRSFHHGGHPIWRRVWIRWWKTVMKKVNMDEILMKFLTWQIVLGTNSLLLWIEHHVINHILNSSNSFYHLPQGNVPSIIKIVPRNYGCICTNFTSTVGELKFSRSICCISYARTEFLTRHTVTAKYKNLISFWSYVGCVRSKIRYLEDSPSSLINYSE